MAEQDDKPDDAGFLSRWSHRKNHNVEEDNQQQQSVVAEAERKEIAEEKLKTDADMQPIESLTEDSDYTGFLSPKVSEALRKQALRRLFHIPALNVVDGLDDYAEDFTNFEPLGDLVTEEMKRMFIREKKKEEEKEKAEAEAKEKAQNESVESIDDTDVEAIEAADDTAIGDDEVVITDVNPHEDELSDEEQAETLLNNKDNIEHE